MIQMTQKQLGELVGRTDRQLRNIDKEQPDDKKLFVRSGGSKCDAALFVQRWCELMVERATKGSADLDVVKARHEIIKTQKTQLEVMRMRGDLIDVQDVKKLWGDIANTIMQSMLHLPSTIAPMVRGLDNIEVINSIINSEIRRVLEALSETPLPEYAADHDSAPEDEP